jgi:hypothetical protein
LSDPRVVLVGSAIDEAGSSASLRTLAALNLPHATRYIVTRGKFDTQNLAKTANVEAGYPSEPAQLQTLASWAECPLRKDPRFRDGYDLYCLRTILARTHEFDYALLIREQSRPQLRWPELLAAIAGTLFLTISSDDDIGASNLMLNLADERASAFLDSALELYFTGAAYAISPYSFENALLTAADALRLASAMDYHSRPNVTE